MVLAIDDALEAGAQHSPIPHHFLDGNAIFNYIEVIGAVRYDRSFSKCGDTSVDTWYPPLSSNYRPNNILI